MPSMPQWVYSWYGWGRPAGAASVAEGSAGLVVGAAGPLPHAARSMAMTAPAIGGPPRPSKPFSISLLARVRSASPFGRGRVVRGSAALLQRGLRAFRNAYVVAYPAGLPRSPSGL